jgi:hypothetical protein
MAIVTCPGCEKHISSHTVECPYCGFQRDEEAEERLRELRRRGLRDRVYYLKMTSYAALALLIVALGWYLTESPDLQGKPPIGSYILFAVGTICYLLIRIYLHKFKAALKRLGT